MDKTKNNIFKKFYNWFLTVNIYHNREDTDKEFYLHFLYKSFAIFLSLFLSFVFPVLQFLPILVISVVVLTENSYNRIYYFALITPFWFVCEKLTFVYGLMCCLWIIKILRDFLNKEIKISKRLLILVMLVLIYGIADLKFSLAAYWFVVRAVCLFLVAFLYRDKIDYKRLIIAFTIGVLYSGIAGLLGVLLKGFYSYGAIINYSGGNFRFCGSVTDPNIFSILCLTVLATLSFAFLNKNINFALYATLLPVFISFNIITGSKMGFFIMLFVLMFSLGVLLFKKEKDKWLQIGLILLIIALCLVIFSKNVASIFSRLSLEPAQESLSKVEGMNFAVQHPILNSILNSGVGKKLSSITTYRFNLWVYYLGVLLDNPINFFFGFRKYRLDFDIIINGQILSQPHNSIMDIVLTYGLMFLVLLTIVVVLYILHKKKKNFKFNKLAILPIITIGLAVCAISLFWSEVFMLLVLMLIFSIFEKRGEESEDIVDQ